MRQLFLNTLVDAHSLGASFNSSSLELPLVELLSAQLIWTDSGSLSGTVNLQASNDNTNWVSVGSQALSGSSTAMINKSDILYKYVRIAYTRTAGSGSLTVLVNAKGASAVQA
jgi:hypothetical protein